MTAPLVSVITPVYNDEPYLEQCIKSVLAQTLDDFEYLICDNHSTDRSGTIARDLAATDRRIRVITPSEFLPQVRNFNFALQQIDPRAKYCKMVLSDDWIFPECLAKMTTLAEQHPTVGLVSSYRLIEELPNCFGVPVERSVFPGKEAMRWQLLGQVFPFGTPSTVMYRADLVRQSPDFFPAGRFCFDIDVAFRILLTSDFGFVHQVLSFTRYQSGALIDVAGLLKFWPLLHVLILWQFGRDVLSPEEFARREAQATKDYYRSLGAACLDDCVRGRINHALWDFQRENLASLGRTIRATSVAWGATRAALEALTCPRDIVMHLRRATQAAYSRFP